MDLPIQGLKRNKINTDNVYLILSISIRRNSFALAKRVLKKYNKIYTEFGLDCKDYLLLAQALKRGRKKIAKLLLHKECNVNYVERTNFFHTPLYYATKLGDYELVSMLLERGAVINDTDYGNETALALAFRQKKYDLIKLMLSKYFTQNEKIDKEYYRMYCDNLFRFNSIIKKHYIAYCIACLTNNEEAIERFNKEIKFINHDQTSTKTFFKKLKHNNTWYKNKFKLHFAVDNGLVELVDLLLMNGYDVNEKDAQGRTALHLVYIKLHTSSVGQEENLAMIDLILNSHEQNTENCSDENGLSHFHIACERKNLTVVKNFIKSKIHLDQAVSIKSPILKRHTPLHCAARTANFDVISLLVKENANVNSYLLNGVTPLHMIFFNFTKSYHSKKYQEKYRNILNLILSNERNLICDVNYKGLPTYLHVACSVSDSTTVKKLIKKGENINQAISLRSEILPGFTPLHCAVWFQNLDTVRELLKYNADINATCAEGLTPLHLAWLKNSHSIEIDLNSVDTFKIYNVYNIIDIHSINDMRINSAIIDVLLSAHKVHYANSIDRKRGISHFHIACTRNNLNFIKNFIQSGNFSLRVNQRTFLNSLCVLSLATPLHCAVKFNQVNVVNLLLKHGADVNAVNENGSTPLLEACQFSYYKIYELLLMDITHFENNEKSDSLIDETLKSIENNHFWRKNRNDNLFIVNLLLKHGSNVNIKDRFCEPLLAKMFDSENYFIIFDRLTENLRKYNLIKLKTFNAIRDMIKKEFKIRRKEIIKILLDYNIDTNATDYKKNTVLHLLADDANMDDDTITIFELLLNKGANINAKNVNGSTPLHIAVRNRHLKIEFLKLLIKRQADVNCTDEDGKTPFHLICKNLWSQSKSENIMDILVAEGVDINARDKYSLTPLHVASLSNNVNIVLKLLNCGADINAEHAKNRTLIHFLIDNISNFIERSNGQIYFILKEHAIKLNEIGMLSANVKKFFSKDDNIFDTIDRTTSDGGIVYGEVFSVFAKKCKYELTKMKNLIIRGQTLYDILFKTSNQMMIYLKNDTFLNILKSNNLDVEFPIYGYLLKLQFKKGLNRKSLMGPATNKFCKVVIKNLPDLCVENILKYLDNLDLKNISQL